MIFTSKNAFTLAEVLITLAIIGIVASMTIPSVLNSTNNSETVAKVRKYQSVISQALILAMADKGITSLESVYSSNDEFWTDLKNKLNVMKDCGFSAGEGCFPKGVVYKSLNGSDRSVFDDSTTEQKAILADGTMIKTLTYNTNCDDDASISHSGDLSNACVSLGIDINGNKGPNQVGRDYFSFRILKSGKVLPVGTPNDVINGCDLSSADVSPGSNGAPGHGSGCTAKILTEGDVNY